MKKEKVETILRDVEEYLDSIPGDTGITIKAERIKSLLYEINISNWRQVTNIANEIREEIEYD